MAENLILVCYLLFSGCIVVALLNVYWQELLHLPHLVYDCIRGWFKIDTPSEREWSLIKASVISALFIAGYLWWLNTHMAFVSQFPGTLVITVIAIPVAWILWIWRNQDKRETLNNEKVKIEQTEKELGWKEDDRLWNNFFERQKMASAANGESENVKITALHALKSYLTLDENSLFSERTRLFLRNILNDAMEKYRKNFRCSLWAISSLGSNVVTESLKVATRLLYPDLQETLRYRGGEPILYPGLTISDQVFPAVVCENPWMPYSIFERVEFCTNWTSATLSFCYFDMCSFVPKSSFSFVDFTETRLDLNKVDRCRFFKCYFAKTTLSGEFQTCLFQNTLFWSNQQGFRPLKINKSSFENCLLINSPVILKAIICSSDNSSSKISFLQFPYEFILKYEEERRKFTSQSPYLVLYREIQKNYLSSFLDQSILNSNKAREIQDLYQAYTVEREARYRGRSIDAESVTHSLYNELFGGWGKEQLPYLQELLDMAFRFGINDRMDWSILDRAYEEKKADLE